MLVGTTRLSGAWSRWAIPGESKGRDESEGVQRFRDPGVPVLSDAIAMCGPLVNERLGAHAWSSDGGSRSL